MHAKLAMVWLEYDNPIFMRNFKWKIHQATLKGTMGLFRSKKDILIRLDKLRYVFSQNGLLINTSHWEIMCLVVPFTSPQNLQEMIAKTYVA